MRVLLDMQKFVHHSLLSQLATMIHSHQLLLISLAQKYCVIIGVTPTFAWPQCTDLQLKDLQARSCCHEPGARLSHRDSVLWQRAWA